MEALDDTILEDTSGRQVEEAVIILQNSSKTGSRRSAATMNRIKSTFRSFFKWAFQSGLISHNPAASLPMSRAASQRTTPITKEGINTLLHTISESGDPYAERDEALLATYAFTGIRCAEALALRVKDYDRSSLTLYLPKVKGANSRQQPIPQRLSCILGKWISILCRNGQADSGSLLFRGRNPERSLTTRQIRFRFNRWKALSGIKEDLTVHSFRVGFATQLYRATGDLLLVHHAIGHADVRTTVRYIGTHLLEIRKAIENGFC